MTINYVIEKYESLLAHYELMSKHEMDPYTTVSYSAEIRQLIEWLKDYKRLLKEEEKWKDSTDCIDRVQAQTEIEMNASRYTIARERDGMGQIEWSDQLIKVSDAVDIIKHLPPVTPQESENVVVTNKNLCDSCTFKGCIFQSGIVRNHCDFYKAESEE